MALTLAPCTLEEANAFVAVHHRHHQPTPVAKFSIAAVRDESVVGVVIVGLPKGVKRAGEVPRVSILRDDGQGALFGEAQAVDAVDPSAADPGTLTTRDA